MKYNIFYLDDELENLRAFTSVFRREYNIFTTDSPSQGLDYLHNNKVDLIVTDQRMPEMTGVDFLEQVFKFIPEKPPCRVIFSGYSETRDIDEAKKKNWLSLFISKSCDPEELKVKLDTIIYNCNN
jgi:response regulator RpfG family c-di-GMP phosphodiesterase